VFGRQRPETQFQNTIIPECSVVAKSDFSAPRITGHALMPPWGSTAEWRELHHTLSHTIATCPGEMKRARNHAGAIREQLLFASEAMERLCAKTCTHCPAVCFLSAKIWADFKDALFWHLTDQAVPLRQTISHSSQVCAYLGRRGCSLPRMSRPFVCAWYLCPTQVARLQTSPNHDECEGLQDTLASAKRRRKKMESTFVEAVVSYPFFAAHPPLF
jgi:hypothetical protein